MVFLFAMLSTNFCQVAMKWMQLGEHIQARYELWFFDCINVYFIHFIHTITEPKLLKLPAKFMLYV